MKTPKQILAEGIDVAKMRVKVAMLKKAKVLEDENAFKGARGGWQIAFYLKTHNDALKLISVAVLNDFKSFSPSKDGRVWEVTVNLDESHS